MASEVSFGVALVILMFILLRSLAKSNKVTLVLIAGPNPIPLAMSIQAHQPDRVLLISTLFDDESEVLQQKRLDARARLTAWLRGGDELVSTFDSLDEPFPIPFTPPEGYQPEGDSVPEIRWEERNSDDVEGIIGLIEEEQGADEDYSTRMDIRPGAKAAVFPLFFSAVDIGLPLWYTLETGGLLELSDAGWIESGKGPNLSVVDRGWLGGYPIHAVKVRREAPSQNEGSLLWDVGLSIAPEEHMAPKDVERQRREWESRLEEEAEELWIEDLMVNDIAHGPESARILISDSQEEDPSGHGKVLDVYRKRASKGLESVENKLNRSDAIMRNSPLTLSSSGFRRRIADKGYRISEEGAEIIVSKGTTGVPFQFLDEEGKPAGFFLEPLVEGEIWRSWGPEETLLNISIIDPRIEDRKSRFQKQFTVAGGNRLKPLGRKIAKFHSIDIGGDRGEVVEAVSEVEFSRLSKDDADVEERLRFIRAAELDVLMLDEYGITMFDAKVVLDEIDVAKRGFHNVSWLNRAKHHYVVSSNFPKIEYGGVIHFQRLSRGRDVLSQDDQGLTEQVAEILELERSGCFSESDSASFKISGVRFVYHPSGRMYRFGARRYPAEILRRVDRSTVEIQEQLPDIGVILPEPELCITGHAILSDIAKKGYLSGKIGAVAKYPLPERKSFRRFGWWLSTYKRKQPWQRYWVNSNFAESISGDPKIAIFATEKPIDGYEGVRIVSSTVEIRRGAGTDLMRLDRADWEMFVEKIQLEQLRLHASQWAFDPTLDEVFETAISEGMNDYEFSQLFIKLRGTTWWRYAGMKRGSKMMKRMRGKINGGFFGNRMSFVEVEAEDGSSDWRCSKWVGDIEGPTAKDEIWVLDHDWPE